MRANMDIAIIGMSCIFPGAGSVDDFWNNIMNKVDAIRTASPGRLDPVYFSGGRQAADHPDHFYCSRGGFIDEFALFDPAKFGILPLAVEGTEPEQLLSLSLAHRALADAGLFEKGDPPSKTGIIIGKGNYAGPGVLRAIEIIHSGQQLAALLKDLMPGIAEEEVERIKKEFQKKKGRYAPDTVMGLIPNLTASLIANRLDLAGPAYTVDAACASSLIAVDHAVKELLLGKADLMIAGGVHASQNATFWSVFTQLGALSKNQQIRPFDRRADGLLIGEGCGFVVLKRLEEAVQDGDRIYAVIKGIGVASDGAGASLMSPSVQGQTSAIRQAWSNAGLEPGDIGYIEAHGTGTPLGDRIELETLTAVFGGMKRAGRAEGRKPGIGSVKSNIGHAMPAAGMAGLIKTAMALYHRMLPPTLHCEEPLDMMEASGFEPVSETIDWDATGLPARAGVNAFGFGGINAHIVLEGHGESRTGSRGQRGAGKHGAASDSAAAGNERLLLLAAVDRDGLIAALEAAIVSADEGYIRDRDHHAGEGRYRIAIFDPSPDRLRMAIKIVRKDKPWRNRQDIWFSHESFLRQGKRTAFLFPGLDGLGGGEIGSVAAGLGLDHAGSARDTDKSVLSSALQLAERSQILYQALRKLDIRADLHAGHSVGEWLAGYAAGWGEENDVIGLMRQLDADLFEEKDIAFLVVGCGLEQLRPLLASFEDIHLSNDNCPNQVIVCGKDVSIGRLTALLRERQVFHQQLSFRSGFHSPFLQSKLPLLQEAYGNLRFKKPGIPLWSATTLEEYPATHEEICALGVRHLLEPVRFRELVEKLYAEGVRIFIQVGSGGLTGFVDNTLKGEDYSALSANIAGRSGMGQLRRVLAALFAEGREGRDSLLPEAAAPAAPVKKEIHSRPMQLRLGTPLLKSLDSFRQISSQAPVHSGRHAAQHARTQAPSSPIVAALLENQREIEQAQSEILGLFMPQTISHRLDISLENHPYLIDHSLFRQPPGWQCVADKDPVIPMTMMLEVFSEIAESYAAGNIVSRMANINILQWMSVVKPFREEVAGRWLAPGRMEMKLEKFASAEISFDNDEVLSQAMTAAAASLGSFDIGPLLPIRITPAGIYEQYMFHESAYRGIREIVRIAEKGIIGMIESGEGKGSLLDNAGQLFGFWLQLVLPQEKVAFPVKIKEILFYGDRRDQRGLFECSCLLTDLSDEFATASMLLKKDGKVWALIRGWQDRRLELDDRFWRLAYAPLRHFLSEEIAPGIFFFQQVYQRVLSWDFVSKRYFGKDEREYGAGLPPKKKNEWLISRIAAKDAVRAALSRERDRQLYPIEILIRSDEKGRPYPYGEKVPEAWVTLAHKRTDAVAMASLQGPVGIDMEIIEDRGADFVPLMLHPEERDLLAGKDMAEWITRCWVAKEAYGKYLGLGLQGSPLRYRIRAIAGEDLMIEDVVITTFKYKNYIIGWTHK